ncbi:hypothetical protein JI641_14425 [Listeria ivanovii subsp. londoniensis]|uniref:hypothetical protein n=1 Tax=Listeria ivanovii TaxID=1638 RepID=UPI001906FBE2|nr:hypothetical protein [Listeria ivanovii]MBK2004176.1 hypothetical protein [Listeria ivanovii subsp. londoniensis]
MSKKIKECMFNFVENKIIFGYFIIFWVIVIVFFLFQNPCKKAIDFFSSIMSYFYLQQDMMVTSATVLIGIYFTMYTIFAVYNSSSVISKLYTDSFQKLLKLLKHAMVSSILVLVFGFLTDWVFSLNEMFTYIINFFFNLYFIITSSICGAYIYLIFKKDINGLEAQRIENREKEILQNNLKVFLEREQRKEDKRLNDIN